MTFEEWWSAYPLDLSIPISEIASDIWDAAQQNARADERARRAELEAIDDLKKQGDS